MAVTTTIMAAEGTTTGTAEGTKTLSRGRRPAASITCAVAEIGPDHQRRWERVIVSSTLGTVVADGRRPISSRTIRKSAKGQREELAMAVTTTIMAAEGTTTGTAEGTKTLSRGRRPAASITCAVAEIGPDHQRRWERVIVSSTLGTVVADGRRPISSRFPA
ncbi:hypothetical protein GPALN_013367 [Globodera pallida]|nr:hypothetical protein GPALN_013367 [Globodera pallida]